MKKLVLLGAIATLGLASCTKEHTCTCDYSEDGVTNTSTSTVKSSKSVARATCEGEGYEIISIKSNYDGTESEATAEDIAEWNKSDSDCTLD